MVSKTSLAWCLGMSLVGVACANEPPTPASDIERAKPVVLVTVDRSDPASADAQGSASAVARFVSVPAFADPTRALSATGATLELPPVDTCQGSDSQDELEPPPASQGSIEFLEAGDVAITALGSVTPLVPHAFPSVAGFASGVLYTTRDRASSALPSAVPYSVSTTGSASMPAFHTVADAPKAPSAIQLAGVGLGEVIQVHTGQPIELTWTPGEPTDIVYAELLAYDGTPSVVCTFHDESGTGTVAADAFAGAGTGRVALHRVRSRRFGGGAAPSGEVRFDFQVGASVEFAK